MGRYVRLPLLMFLLWLCVEPSLAQASTAATLHQQIDAQVKAWADKYGEHDPKINIMNQAHHLGALLHGLGHSTSPKTNSFLQYAEETESKIESWASKHSVMFGKCFARSAISDDHRKNIQEQLLSEFGWAAPFLQTRPGDNIRAAFQIAELSPAVQMLTKQFADRPDWAISALNFVNSTYLGKNVITQLKSWMTSNAETQELLELEGANLSSGTGLLTDTIGSVRGSAYDPTSLSHPDFLETISSVPTAFSGQQTSDASSDMSNGFASDTISSSQQQFSSAAGSSLYQSLDSSGSISASGTMASSFPGLLAEYLSSIPSSHSSSNPSSLIPSLLEIESQVDSATAIPAGTEATLYELGLEGSDSTSGSSIDSVTSSQGSSANLAKPPSPAKPATKGDGAGGCCLALVFVIILLGIGCAAEFYINSMHKVDGPQYEAYLGESITHEVNQFKEYLKLHPDRLAEIGAKLQASGDIGSSPDSDDKLLKVPLDFTTIISEVDSDAPDAKQEREAMIKSGDLSRTRSQAVFAGVPSDKRIKTKTSKPDAGSGSLLVIFYMAYNAIPEMVSKRFGFYLFGIIMAVVIAALSGGFQG